jgi:hypothetical protein
MWIKKMMDNSSWKDLIKLRYPVLDKNFIFKCSLKLEDIYNVLIKNKFWKDIIKYFFELKLGDELNLHSVIWYNSHLKLEGKTIFYQELFDKGVILIRLILFYFWCLTPLAAIFQLYHGDQF